MPKKQANLLILFISILTIGISFLFLIDISSYLRGPGVYPPNWRWPYELSFKFPEILAPVSVLILIISTLFLNQIKRNEKLFILVLIFLGFLLQISLLYYGRAGIGVIIHRILNENINGYFTASLSINSIPNFLNNFNERLVNLPMYAKFHPPFAVLFFDFLNRISSLFIDFMPQINSYKPSHPDVANVWSNLQNNQKLTVLYSGFLISFLSLLSMIPIYLTTKILYGIEAAKKSAYLFALAPGILLFTPLNDIFLPIFGLISFYLFVNGMQKGRAFYYLLSGFVLCLGAYFSFTFLPFILLFGIYYLSTIGFKIKHRDINNGLFFSVGFIFIPIALLLFGNNIIEMFLKIMFFHEEAQHYRPYSIWIFYNLYDFFLFVGLPTVFLFFSSLLLSIRKKIKLDLLLISFFIFILILDLSGSVRAETGRIWIPLIPLMIIPVANFLTDIKINRFQFSLILGALGVQIIVFQTVLITLY